MVPSVRLPGAFRPAHDPRRGLRSTTKALLARLAENTELMEAFNVLAFHRACSRALPDGAPDEARISSYAVSLDPDPLGSGRPLFSAMQVSSPRRARRARRPSMETFFMEGDRSPA